MLQIGPGLKLAIVINNYLHDVATAVLLASAVILWILARQAHAEGPDAVRFLADAYPMLTKFAAWALVWIVIGGIPRAIFFQQVEWNLSDPSNQYLFAALIIKHILMWGAVIGGAALWVRVRKQVRS